VPTIAILDQWLRYPGSSSGNPRNPRTLRRCDANQWCSGIGTSWRSNQTRSPSTAFEDQCSVYRRQETARRLSQIHTVTNATSRRRHQPSHARSTDRQLQQQRLRGERAQAPRVGVLRLGLVHHAEHGCELLLNGTHENPLPEALVRERVLSTRIAGSQAERSQRLVAQHRAAVAFGEVQSWQLWAAMVSKVRPLPWLTSSTLSISCSSVNRHHRDRSQSVGRSKPWIMTFTSPAHRRRVIAYRDSRSNIMKEK